MYLVYEKTSSCVFFLAVRSCNIFLAVSGVITKKKSDQLKKIAGSCNHRKKLKIGKKMQPLQDIHNIARSVWHPLTMGH